jgi:Flp pilus assembly protein TadG
MRLKLIPRSGATIVEFAIVGPVTFLLLFGLLVGGMGMFRYMEIASLARAASRWASVHGTQYQQDTGNPAATSIDIYNNAIVPNAVSLDMSQLNYAVTWNTSNSPYHTIIVNNQVTPVGNTVTVALTYQWIPEWYLGGITLTSTSTVPMTE